MAMLAPPPRYSITGTNLPAWLHKLILKSSALHISQHIMSHEAPPSAPKELWLRDLSDEEFFKDADGKKSLYEVGKVRLCKGET